jgi:DNA-binding SARP family transcriptional activator
MIKTVTKPLIVKMLGQPEARYDGQLLRFRSRKVLALLLYLVVTGEWHRRDTLLALLWPESDKKRGRTSLRTTITRLRQSLAEASPLIATKGDLVGIAPDAWLDLDLRHIEAALDTTDEAPIQTALALIRGEFLEGFSLNDAPEFDAWVSVQREHWHQQIETMCGHLYRIQRDRGEHHRAVETAGRWVAVAPLSEAAYQSLMEAYLLVGARTAALKAYENCCTMLAEEFGVKPMVETERLAEQGRQMQSSGRAAQASEVSPVLTVHTFPLIGRATEHQHLVQAYHQTAAGQAQIVVISGEAGIGKTRLVEDFLGWLKLQPTAVDILSGRAFEMGGRLPYQPLVKALRERIERENAPEDLLADVWLAELSRVLPELLDRYPDLSVPLVGDAEIARARLFEAVAAFGNALAGRGPAAFLLDDLQWAHEGTLDMLQYVAQRWREAEAPILVMITVRQEALNATPTLNEWFSRLERETRLSRLTLSALTIPDAQELVTALAEPTVPKQIIHKFGLWLHTETKGSPFFIDALLRMLIEREIMAPTVGDISCFDIEGALSYIQQTEHIPLPPTVREVIVNRLQQLDDQAGALLVAASVIGRDCTFERLCQISGINEIEGLSALEALLQNRLLLEVTGKRPYTFAHDNIRKIVYTQVGEARRRVYHRRAFQALEQAQAPAAELAFHAQAAHLDGAAFHYILVAGEEAATTFGFDEAIEQFTAAWNMVRTGEFEATEDQLVNLCQNYGRALEMGSRFDVAYAFFEEVERFAQEATNQSLRLVAIMGQATIRALSTALQDTELAERLATNALELARFLGDHSSEAKALWLLQLRHAFSRQRFDLAVSYGEASLTIAREHDLREQLAYTLHDLVAPYRELERMTDAQAAEDEARDLFQELNNLPMLADSYNGKAYWSYGGDSDYDAVLAFATKGLELSRAIGNLYNQYSALLAMALTHFEIGHFGTAIQQLQESTEILIEIKAGQFYEVQGSLCLLYGELGLKQKVRSIHQRIIDHLDEIPEWTLVRAVSQSAQGSALIGDVAKAAALFQKIDGLYSPEMSIYAAVPVARTAATLFWLQNRPDELLALLEHYLPHLTRPGTRVWGLPELYYWQGQAYIAKGETERGLSVLSKARELSVAIGERRFRWRILTSLADLQEERDLPTAADLRQEARVTLQFIIDHIPEGELRASFMGLPAVQRLWADSR